MQKQNTRPSYLKKGDAIALVSTARKISREELSPAIKEIESWDLEVIEAPGLYNAHNQFAGASDERASSFQAVLDNPKVKAILCVRGGYGTVKILNKLNFSSFRKNPKWIAGYSDVCVLHNHINQNFGIETLHSTMPISFANNSEDSIASLRDALFGKLDNYTFPISTFRTGKAKGELIGGNLSILYSLMGTPSQLDTKGKILFIEDLDEYLYHLDRMMMNLKHAGVLNNLAALLIGGMSDMRDNTKKYGFSSDNPYGMTGREIIEDIVSEYNYPVCFNFPSGHENRNMALYMGRGVELEMGESEITMNLDT